MQYELKDGKLKATFGGVEIEGVESIVIENEEAKIKRECFEEAARRCEAQGLYLAPEDNQVYNIYGLVVAKYLGFEIHPAGRRNLKFENAKLETEWEKAKVLNLGR